VTLSLLGWDDSLASQFHPFSAAGLVPARVALHHKNAYELLLETGVASGTCTRRLLHASLTRADLPAIGDWVAVCPRPGEACVDIHAVLPRRTYFSRRAAGDAPIEQILAANIDTVLLVTALDQNFNLRRIERYLAAAWQSGAAPVIVLNKADLHAGPQAMRAPVAAIAPDVPLVILSASRGQGFEELAPWLQPGRTVAFLSSSGVGKSTLINHILGEDRQATGALSDAAQKGTHTTTHRELMVAPSGVLVIDTPGMRELQLWDTADSTALDHTFADIAGPALHCRFRNCSHHHEPGCAVQSALQSGEISEARWRSFQKLQRQQTFTASKADGRIGREQNQIRRRINKAFRARAQHTPKHYDP
jgi:ribosome biogenesis GTPase